MDVLSVRLASPPAEEQPAGTAAAQVLSESVAVGARYGVNERLAVPPVIEMLVPAAAPVTTNGAGCFHLVGSLPEGTVHLILNLGGAAVVLVGVGRAAPLKMVAQLLAVPGNVELDLSLYRSYRKEPSRGDARAPGVAQVSLDDHLLVVGGSAVL